MGPAARTGCSATNSCPDGARAVTGVLCYPVLSGNSIEGNLQCLLAVVRRDWLSARTRETGSDATQSLAAMLPWPRLTSDHRRDARLARNREPAGGRLCVWATRGRARKRTLAFYVRVGLNGSNNGNDDGR